MEQQPKQPKNMPLRNLHTSQNIFHSPQNARFFQNLQTIDFIAPNPFFFTNIHQLKILCQFHREIDFAPRPCETIPP
jgi:hypothetical protein